MAKSKIFRWILESVWPWFVKHVWPEIEKLLIAIFADVIKEARAVIFEWLNRRQKRREQGAQRKAAEAEQAAQNSQNESEAEKHRAVAQVWREVAEQFRQDNEELKKKLDEELKKSSSDFRDKLNAMDLKNVIEESDDGTLQIKSSGTTLQLPEPSDES